MNHKEGRVLKNQYFQNMVLEKTLDSPFDSKENKLVNSKRNQIWILMGRTDARAEIPIIWPPDVKSWLIGKGPDTGKDWRQWGEGDNRGWDGCMVTDLMDMSLSKFRELVTERETWRAVVHGVTKSRTRLSDWTELNDVRWILSLSLMELCRKLCNGSYLGIGSLQM